MKSKSQVGDTLKLLAEDVGVPTEMVTDNAKEYTESGTVFQKTARFLNMLVTTIEPHTPRQNPAERVIGDDSFDPSVMSPSRCATPLSIPRLAKSDDAKSSSCDLIIIVVPFS